MRRLLFCLLFVVPAYSWAQTVTTNPAVPNPNQPVTITVDVTGTSLDGFPWNNTTNPVWIWAWLEKSSGDVDAPTNVNPATSPGQDAAKCTRISTSPDVYQITFTATTFFNKPASEITEVGLKLKSRNWSDNKQTDNNRSIFFSLNFAVTFSEPTQPSFLVNTNDPIDITVNTNENATIVLKTGGSTIASSGGSVTEFSHQRIAAETSGSIEIICEANNGTETKSISFTYTIRSATLEEPRPPGIVDGINYDANPSNVTLSLLAPEKSSVYVVGDFNDWSINADFQMKKDGEHFWLEVDGLTPGEEYGYKYFVDETIWLADPYADKILDPEDQYIEEATYPNLKPYPDQALNSEWYFNRVSVLQTDQQPYEWQVNDFEKPAKEKLIVYELLIRDFFEDGDNNYQSLIDTISYFKTLGINAIELMPIMEFGGNNSWGYNPQFMFAPDKAYGPKNKFKEFVDVCHQNGIAVILDIALNHQDMPNPYLLMDFNYSTFKPNPTNKWFNVDATHPYSVFYDMNHESLYTKDYLDTINYYWLNEYKIDGFRFDLSKGFTQVNNPNNVDAWGQYDASRVAILTRMADKIWEYFPDAYVILEHLAVNSEEKVLAEYRAGEGKGMMLWGNINEGYLESSMGYGLKSNISHVYYANRSWTVPHLVSYMESHDEERMMVKNIAYGNSSGDYDVKDFNTGLRRVKAASTIFYTIPGPKMLWQFGELGYDFGINYCEEDGTIDDECRTYPKPVHWDYREDYSRYNLYTHISDLLRLRREFDLFSGGTATINSSSDLGKQLILRNNPYTATPANASEMNAVVVVNFDVNSKAISVDFPHAGTWYEYYGYGTELAVTSTPQSVTLPPGAFKLYTDVEITNPVVTSVHSEFESDISLYPNPVQNLLRLASEVEVIDVTLRTLQGVITRPTRLSQDTWDVSSLASGLYIVDVRTTSGLYKIKLIKNR